MWLLLAFLSATLLGFYDVFKKHSLSGNAVIPVLFLNTLFSSLIFLPFILVSYLSPSLLDQTMFFVPTVGWEVQKYIVLKSFIVLSSWILGYFGMKHLPITIVGPINATRPVMVLVGAMIIFAERLNVYQWIGVVLSIVSLFMLSRSSKREGVDFRHNVWILCIAAAAVVGAASGLYDRYIMRELDAVFVQGWCNVYQCALMLVVVLVTLRFNAHSIRKFHWSWAIPAISVLISIADFAYFSALSQQDAMISVVSMIRRGSVVVSFACG